MLNMRSTGDLSARARIRDAALERYARDGFDVGLRAIAADAGVSAPLVLHHFGSKDGLRRACDEYVSSMMLDAKAALVQEDSGLTMLSYLANADDYGPALGYVLRSLQAGGDLARELIDMLVEDTMTYLTAGVETGAVVPSRDEAARARFLVTQAVGGLLVEVTTRPQTDPRDLSALAQLAIARTSLPGLELYTEGLLTDRTMLDAYLEHLSTDRDTADEAPAQEETPRDD